MIHTERLSLIIPDPSYAQAMFDYHQANHEHFRACTPEAAFSLSIEDWQSRLKFYQEAFESKQALRLILSLKGERNIIGNITIDHLVWGAFQAGYLGYRLDKHYEGQGYMSEALRAVIVFVFEEQKLHRLMANYRPENKRSEAVLSNLGFEKEGFAKNYLYLDGAWRDHVLTALVNDVA